MSKGRWILVTIIGVFIAMTFGPQGPAGGFWGAAPAEEMGVTGGLAGAFMAYGLLEALIFGFGLAWLAFGRKTLQGAGATAAWLAIGWGLVSWWPHGGLHQGIGESNPAALVGIEFGFHVTMFVAVLVIASYVWRTASERATVRSAA